MGGLDFPLAYFIPATFASVAVFVSVLGSFLCKFVTIHETTANQDVGIGIWLRSKLYYVENEQDGSYDILRGCGSYADVQFDSRWTAAKAFSIIAAVVGAVAAFLIIFAACLPINDSRWKSLGAAFILACLCQGLTLLFLRSDACVSGQQSVFTDYGTLEFEGGCTLASGANMCIAATVLWFVAGALVCVMQSPNQADWSDPVSKEDVPVIDGEQDHNDEAPTFAEEPAALASAANNNAEESVSSAQ